MPNRNRRNWRGDVALQALHGGTISARAIEAARRVLVRRTSRQGQLWNLIQAYHPVTSKPIEARIGKGKGSIDHYTSPIRAGQFLFEIGGIDSTVAVAALNSAATKFSIRTRVVLRPRLK